MKTKILLTAFFLLTGILLYGQWYTDYLSEPRAQMGVAELESKVYFAGGFNGYDVVSEVEIYDVVNEAWDEAINLSVARQFPSGVASGNKVYFAGGTNFGTLECFSEVDIWDTFSEEWEVEHLSVPRFDIGDVSYGNKVLFAGGADIALNVCYDVVDILDTETGQWSTATLSQPRAAMGSAVVGDLAIFAGGYDFQSVSNQVDIYNFSTDTWSTATLSEARGMCAAVTVGDKLLIAGGMNVYGEPSDRVDIYDFTTNTWTTASLSFARALNQNFVATICNKAYFVGGGFMDFSINNWTSSSDVIDIYDATLDNWSVDFLVQDVTNHGVAGAGNHLVVAGGVWPDPPSWWITSAVEIYVDPDCYNVGVEETGNWKLEIGNSPNPFSSSTTIEFELDKPGTIEISITSLAGQEIEDIVYHGIVGLNEVKWDAGSLPQGIYFLRARMDGEVAIKKMIKL